MEIGLQKRPTSAPNWDPPKAHDTPLHHTVKGRVAGDQRIQGCGEMPLLIHALGQAVNTKEAVV